MFSYFIIGKFYTDKIKYLLNYPRPLIVLGGFEVQTLEHTCAAILLLLKKDGFALYKNIFGSTRQTNDRIKNF